MQYKSLNDVANNPDVHEIVKKRLSPGEVEIWYKKEKVGIVGILDPNNLTKTHVLLGKVSGRIDPIFWAMQGENWSPNGEAKTFIENIGASHTSMSVGDVFVINNVVLEIAMCGHVVWGARDDQWKEIPNVKVRVLWKNQCDSRNCPGEIYIDPTRWAQYGVPICQCGIAYKYLRTEILD